MSCMLSGEQAELQASQVTILTGTICFYGQSILCAVPFFPYYLFLDPNKRVAPTDGVETVTPSKQKVQEIPQSPDLELQNIYGGEGS